MALYGLLALLALPIVLAGAWAVTRALLGLCAQARSGVCGHARVSVHRCVHVVFFLDNCVHSCPGANG